PALRRAWSSLLQNDSYCAALLERVLGWQASGGLHDRRTCHNRLGPGLRGSRRVPALALLLKLQLLLLPGGQRLLLRCGIIGIADRAASRPLLFSLGLVRFPDHRGL